MAKGDHFFVWRKHLGVPYQHHAIDVGDGTVVHFTDGAGGVAGPGGSTAEFQIQQTPIDFVTRNGRDNIHIIRHRHHDDADTIVRRALSQIGRRGYHLVFDNCEHFACWCVCGREESRQVNIACERLSAASVKAAARTGVRFATSVGVKRVLRATPLMLVADVAQWATEAGGHHLGLTSPVERRKAGRAVGGVTALSVGAVGGPVGVALAGSLWAVGEVAGEIGRGIYDKVRDSKTNGPSADPT